MLVVGEASNFPGTESGYKVNGRTDGDGRGARFFYDFCFC